MRTKLPKIDGKTLKDWYEWLKEQDCGCCHMKIGDTELHEVDICMGWHQYEEAAPGGKNIESTPDRYSRFAETFPWKTRFRAMLARSIR